MSSVELTCERDRSIELDRSRVALACIDFQADFLSPSGMSAERGLRVERLANVVPAAAAVLAAARHAGVFVFHTREVYAPDLSDLNRFRRRYDSSIGSPGPLGRFLVRDEPGSEIIDALRPAAGEPVIDKAGFNAFYQTTLDMVLRTRGIETLLLMGLTTQCCVASTLRGAVDLGYGCVLLQDCTAAYDRDDHDATVRVMYSENHNFGWVSDAGRTVDAFTALARDAA